MKRKLTCNQCTDIKYILTASVSTHHSPEKMERAHPEWSVTKCEEHLSNLSICYEGANARLAESFYSTQTAVSVHLHNVFLTTPGYICWRRWNDRHQIKNTAYATSSINASHCCKCQRLFSGVSRLGGLFTVVIYFLWMIMIILDCHYCGGIHGYGCRG